MDDARSLIVHRWRSFFLQNAEIFSNFAVWLHISKLPIELYNSYFLHRIGASLGTMLKIDKTTSIHSRGKFAHICVKLDLSKPLVSHLKIRGYHLNLEYEGLHQICFSCGRYGHKAEHCSSSTCSVKQGECSMSQGKPAKRSEKVV